MTTTVTIKHSGYSIKRLKALFKALDFEIVSIKSETESKDVSKVPNLKKLTHWDITTGKDGKLYLPNNFPKELEDAWSD